MDQAYEMFHEVLVKLFNDIMNIEAKAIITPEFRDITNNDMHVIEAVGIREPRNMSSVAKTLGDYGRNPDDIHQRSGKKRLCASGAKRC